MIETGVSGPRRDHSRCLSTTPVTFLHLYVFFLLLRFFPCTRFAFLLFLCIQDYLLLGAQRAQAANSEASLEVAKTPY